MARIKAAPPGELNIYGRPISFRTTSLQPNLLQATWWHRCSSPPHQTQEKPHGYCLLILPAQSLSASACEIFQAEALPTVKTFAVNIRATIASHLLMSFSASRY
jgi:hypothetical protein